MLDVQQQEHIGRVAVTLQIITCVLAFGVAAFAVVVILMQPTQPAADPDGIITITAAVAAVVALTASVVVPRVMRANMRQSIAEGKSLGQNIPAPMAKELGDIGSLAAVYQTTLIVGAAILEGAAFFNLIAFMLEHQSINLAMSAVLMIAILFKFPTRSAIENWINDELKSIDSLRSLEG